MLRACARAVPGSWRVVAGRVGAGTVDDEMPRRVPAAFPDALCHITTRGAGGAAIYVDDRDRELFLFMLGSVVSRGRWLCFTYCLMTNHYHLVVQTPEPNLDAGMQWLNGQYSRAFNRRHGRRGHLFGSRYRIRLVERDAHLLEAARYVVLNPVRAGVCADPADWPWSSHAATLGTARAPRFLAWRDLLELFGGRSVEEKQRRYANFVAEGAPTASLEGILVS